VSNEHDLKEKLEVLRHERGVSLIDYARLQSPKPQGRWAAAAIEKAEKAAEQGPSYPQQPPNSPWHHDPVPTEPPLGINVNAVDIGEPIAASIRRPK
jgi:hypothetical protein